jgi:hypothetical protein
MTDVVNRVRALNQQALALLKSNDLDRADELLLTAHREMAAWDGPKDDSEVIAAKITTLNNQGCSAKRRGKYLKAVSCFETAMSLERHIGHSVSPITLINLSTALTAMGDMDRACAVAADCLAMIPKADGPMRVIAMHNLAVARHCSGDRPSGIQLLTKALNIAVTVLGENHSTTQQVRQRLRDWTPAASSAAAGAASARGSRGVAVFAPVPPLTGRAAAVRALRSLDFGTPDLVRPQSKPGLAGHRGSPGGDGHAEGLPSKGQVMAGATFAATPTQSQGDKTLPLIASASHDPLAASRTTPQGAREIFSLPALGSHTGTPEVSTVVMPRRKGGETRPPPHTFCRFAVDAINKQPPPRITFADVKRELRSVKAIDTAADEGGNVARMTRMDEQENPFAKRVNEREKRLVLEAAEEKAFLARRVKQEEALAREKERQHKALLVALSRRTHGARIIQQHYRRWRANNKAMLDMKRAHEQKEGVSRAKSVVNFAQKWLHRTAGKRFVARMHTQANFQSIEAAVRTIQKAWKAHFARSVRRRLEGQRTALANALALPERRAYATLTIQTWYRRRCAVWELRTLRRLRYLHHCITIQRWVRGVFHLRKSKLSERQRERAREIAAIRIQRMWRRAAGRFFLSMKRFQVKVSSLRQQELSMVRSIQQHGRAYVLRRRMGVFRAKQIADRKRQHNNVRTEPPTVLGIERASASKQASTYHGHHRRAS